jgi:short chain dehydrogenase
VRAERDDALRTFEGAVAVITGGASGIGRALVGEALARRGAEEVLADRQTDLAEAGAAGNRSAGGKAAAVKLDVTDLAAFDVLVREVMDNRGRLDYLINNAGIGIGGRVERYQIEDRRALDLPADRGRAGGRPCQRAPRKGSSGPRSSRAAGTAGCRRRSRPIDSGSSSNFSARWNPPPSPTGRRGPSRRTRRSSSAPACLRIFNDSRLHPDWIQ